MSAPLLRLSLLGGFQTRLEPGGSVSLPTRKADALLAYLALARGPCARDALAALLWGDVADGQARRSLRQTLYLVRKALERAAPSALVIEAETVSLARDVVVDARDFERLVTRGAPDDLEAAAALYRGDLLAGLRVTEASFEEWLVPERERLRELAVTALRTLLAHQMRNGAHERAVPTAVRLLALDPLQEPVHRALMTLYAEQGRRATALRQYQTCLAALQRELGVEPESETRELYRRILRRSAPSERPDASPAPSSGARGESSPDEAPLVGRDAELTRLRRARTAAWDGRGRLVLVHGEAGIGKSRLVAELTRDTIRAGGRVLVGRAYETQQILPFAPWMEAIRSAGGQPWSGLDHHWRAELARLFPEVSAPSAETAPAGGDPVRLFEALALVIAAMAKDAPLVVVVEDGHWADDMSLRFLGFLTRRIARQPAMVVVTARDEEGPALSLLRRVAEELEREGRLDSVALGPLALGDTSRLVAALGGRATQPLVGLGERIWRASAGNPFMVVETVRVMREGRAAEASSALPLADRIRGVIAGRLGRLGARERHLVAVAAAVGAAFDFTLLQRACGLGAVDAAEAVETLVGRRILHAVGERLDFTHDWIRQVAYEAASAPRRPALHRAVAEAIEAQHGAALAGRHGHLALQWARAEDPGRAIHHFVRAAEEANRVYATGDALAALGDALDLVDRLPPADRDRSRIDLLLRQCFSLSLLGRFAEIVERLLPHRERVERLDDAPLAGAYFFRLALTASYLGERDRVRDWAELALEAGRRADDRAIAGKAHYVLALECYWSGRLADGVAHGRHAVRSLERTTELHWLGLAYYILGFHHYVRGEFGPALEAERQVERIGASTGDARLMSFGAYTTGLVLAARGEGDAAVAAARRGLDHARDPVNIALASGGLGVAYLEHGQPDSAIEALERSLAILARSPLPAVRGHYTALLAEACLAKGDVARARTLAAEAVDVAQHARFAYGLACARRALGRAAMAEGAWAEAAPALGEALAGFARIEACFEVARTRLALAQVAMPGTGAGHLAEARATFEALGVKIWTTRADELAERAGGAVR